VGGGSRFSLWAFISAACGGKFLGTFFRRRQHFRAILRRRQPFGASLQLTLTCRDTPTKNAVSQTLLECEDVLSTEYSDEVQDSHSSEASVNGSSTRVGVLGSGDISSSDGGPGGGLGGGVPFGLWDGTKMSLEQQADEQQQSMHGCAACGRLFPMCGLPVVANQARATRPKTIRQVAKMLVPENDTVVVAAATKKAARKKKARHRKVVCKLTRGCPPSGSFSPSVGYCTDGKRALSRAYPYRSGAQGLGKRHQQRQHETR
jgi:hypothetical protein